VHELDEAARAVAALLDLAAVGVEDAVAEVGAPGGLHDEDLVAADTAIPICKEAQLLFLQGEFPFREVENHEIVARAVHLGEPQAQERITWQMRSTEAWSRIGLMGSESTVLAAASACGSARPRFASA